MAVKNNVNVSMCMYVFVCDGTYVYVCVCLLVFMFMSVNMCGVGTHAYECMYSVCICICLCLFVKNRGQQTTLGNASRSTTLTVLSSRICMSYAQYLIDGKKKKMLSHNNDLMKPPASRIYF